MDRPATAQTTGSASVRAKSLARRARQAAPQSGTADHAAASASKTPEASKTAESGNADRQPHASAASPAEPTRADAASPELAQVVLAQAAELARQPGFQANATHLELAYRVHRILVAARQGELAIPHDVDRDSVRRLSTKCSSPRSFSPKTSTRKRRRGWSSFTKPARSNRPKANKTLPSTRTLFEEPAR